MRFHRLATGTDRDICPEYLALLQAGTLAREVSARDIRSHQLLPIRFTHQQVEPSAPLPEMLQAIGLIKPSSSDALDARGLNLFVGLSLGTSREKVLP